MDRRNFIKSLLGATAAVSVPSALMAEPKRKTAAVVLNNVDLSKFTPADTRYGYYVGVDQRVAAITNQKRARLISVGEHGCDFNTIDAAIKSLDNKIIEDTVIEIRGGCHVIRRPESQKNIKFIGKQNALLIAK